MHDLISRSLFVMVVNDGCDWSTCQQYHATTTSLSPHALVLDLERPTDAFARPWKIIRRRHVFPDWGQLSPSGECEFCIEMSLGDRSPKPATKCSLIFPERSALQLGQHIAGLCDIHASNVSSLPGNLTLTGFRNASYQHLIQFDF
jgi:hypothetical protein